MKEKSKKQFTELSDQELEMVNGGINISILRNKEKIASLCEITDCDVPGYQLDMTSVPCQCVPTPNTLQIYKTRF